MYKIPYRVVSQDFGENVSQYACVRVGRPVYDDNCEIEDECIVGFFPTTESEEAAAICTLTRDQALLLTYQLLEFIEECDERNLAKA